MKQIRWDASKNKRLKQERGISFDEVEACIQAHRVIEIIQNPSTKHRHQRVFVIELNRYVYYVPFRETDTEIILKTIVPSRKLTTRYLKKGGDKSA